jgi:hypothetical protein
MERPGKGNLEQKVAVFEEGAPKIRDSRAEADFLA